MWDPPWIKLEQVSCLTCLCCSPRLNVFLTSFMQDFISFLLDPLCLWVTFLPLLGSKSCPLPKRLPCCLFRLQHGTRCTTLGCAQSLNLLTKHIKTSCYWQQITFVFFQSDLHLGSHTSLPNPMRHGKKDITPIYTNWCISFLSSPSSRRWSANCLLNHR